MKRAVGIEIEAICNCNEIPIERGGYHDGIPIEGAPLWRTESDSSINYAYGNHEFDSWGACCEFVTKTLRLKSSYMSAVKQFKDVFSKQGTLELDKVLVFNTSCGTHITMSGNFMAIKVLPWSILKRLREKFHKEIRESSIGSKDDILAHYYRSFARKSDNMFRNHTGNKNYEFNASKEHRGRGLEWRGVNMLGIRTWAEYDEFFKIIWRCVDYFAQSLNEYQVTERIVPSHYKEEKEMETLRVEPSRELKETILVKLGNKNETTMHNSVNRSCPRCSAPSAGDCFCAPCSRCDHTMFHCDCPRCHDCEELTDDCSCNTCNECGETSDNCDCEDGGNF